MNIISIKKIPRTVHLTKDIDNWLKLLGNIESQSNGGPEPRIHPRLRIYAQVLAGIYMALG